MTHQGAHHSLAHNEAVFREVNESIERGRWPGEQGALVAFRCECAQLGCALLIEMSLGEYETVRTNPRRFIVAIDHHMAAVEIVVDRSERYLVVEKVGEAARTAESTDPRR